MLLLPTFHNCAVRSTWFYIALFCLRFRSKYLSCEKNIAKATSLSQAGYKVQKFPWGHKKGYAKYAGCFGNDFWAVWFGTRNANPRLQVRKQYLSQVCRQQNFLDYSKFQILSHKSLTVERENHVNKSGCSIHICYLCVGWKKQKLWTCIFFLSVKKKKSLANYKTWPFL